jgi:hypothetical protein
MEPQLLGASSVNRRRFVQAAAVAAAGVTGPLAWPARGDASDTGGVEDQASVVPPQPIPGGFAPGIHVWAPGDPTVTLPFSKTTLMGFDVDPTTILDFRGFSAVAFHVGTATGSDGKTYSLETDLRAFKGAYVASDGTQRSGAFAFI